jgi:hypothetical protein
MAAVIQGAQARFRAQLRSAARDLSPESREALLRMLGALRSLADEAAAESGRKAKYVMFAYWKAVAVYCRHFHVALNVTRVR